MAKFRIFKNVQIVFFSLSGIVLLVAGVGRLCCIQKNQEDETFSNGGILNKTDPMMRTKSIHSQKDFQECRILDPATEDPVARRAIRVLQFKACPDTRLVLHFKG